MILAFPNAIRRCAETAVMLAIVLPNSPSLAAQQKPAANPGKALTPEASLEMRLISDLQFSPDGQRLAFVVADPPKGEQRARHVWVYDPARGGIRQFTFSAKNETAPRWSPDGKTLAFLSNRGEENQIYRMRADGGEAWAVTKGKRGINSFEWSPDGKQIAFLAPDAKTEAEEKKEKDKDDAHVVDKEDKRARLWMVNSSGGEARAITPATWEIKEIAWMPAGDRIVVRATDHPEFDRFTERIFGVTVIDGAMKLIGAPRGPFGDLRVAPDGKTLGYTGCRTDGPEPHDLWLQPLPALAKTGGPATADGPAGARNLTGAALDKQILNFRWRKDGGILATMAEGFRNGVVAFGAQGNQEEVAKAEMNPGLFDVSAGGDFAFVGEDGSTPPEIWIAQKSDPPKQVSHLNDSWKQWALSKPEVFRYKSKIDGTEIEGALLRPATTGGPAGAGGTARHDGAAKLPLITLVHGGPTGRWADHIEPWGQLLATCGYAVFYPNIRGSIGYGQKFVEMNRGDWGGADFQDVMDGVHELVARGVADANRLGIGGWSYGGYMAEWAITQTNEFKAAVSGAGMANLISEFGTEENPSYDEWFYGVPWEKPQGFLNSSPLLHLKNAKTPTLVLQGDSDPIDPLGQSQELYRGLKRYGVETELVVYPREPHGFKEEKHLLDRLNRILAWYDKHVR